MSRFSRPDQKREAVPPPPQPIPVDEPLGEVDVVAATPQVAVKNEPIPPQVIQAALEQPQPSYIPRAAPTPPPIPQPVTPGSRMMSRQVLEAYTTPPAPPYSPKEPEWHIPEAVHAEVDYCGKCPKWKRVHPLAPFGQCLAAMRFLGVPLYTPDMGACSWTMEQRAKAR